MSGLIAVDGTFHRLRLPVLTLGSGTAADAVLPELAEIHCIIAPTPSGPAVRSFHADGVRINGDAVMAALLKHGDVIEVGPHSFTVAWHGHNLESEVQRVLDELNEREAELNIRAADLAAEQAVLSEQQMQFDLHYHHQYQELEARSESNLSEQSVRIAELSEQREVFAAERRAFAEQVVEVQAELDRDREQVSAAKIEAELRLDEARETQSAVEEMERRTRAAAAKYLLEQRQQIQSEKDELRTAQKHWTVESIRVQELEQKLTQDTDRLRQESEVLRTETDAVAARVEAAWVTVAQTQAQIAQARAAAEAEMTRRTTEIDAREAVIASSERSAADRLAALQTELSTLEPRVVQARKAIIELETQRLQMTPAKTAPEEWVVPLTIKNDGRSTETLMQQLRQQEQELARERQRLTARLHEAATEREQLKEARAQVSEQVRSLEVARRQWKDAESQNLNEIEQMARMLAQREAELETRAKTMAPANTLQNEQINSLKATLEAWQKSQLEVKTAPVPSVVSFRSALSV